MDAIRTTELPPEEAAPASEVHQVADARPVRVALFSDIASATRRKENAMSLSKRTRHAAQHSAAARRSSST